ncbi:trypsin-like serine peptidase [Streptomyces alanosinicus]|uniref:trypsin-like serine peptidase n=1 Tax=Streptomyces alanosinicus TaxID=68171 RepID=UPI00167997F7|nr:trypsin-like peptidase domain-containing protein [Streptomyces alanosinicus]
MKTTPQEIEEAKAAEAYWTSERIADAVPVDSDKARTPGGRSGVMRSPSKWDAKGIPTAGVFLINPDDDPQKDPSNRDQFCSASVVTSPNKSLVITAAHCLTDNDRHRSLAFAPGWKQHPDKPGKGIAPYGVFPVKKNKIWLDRRYLEQGPVSADDVDFAFLRTGPNSKGQFLENAVGQGNELKTVHSASLAQSNVTLIGFPGDAKKPLVCKSNTRGYQGRFLAIDCDAFAGGSSGGPFIRNFDGRRGDIIGVIDGYKTGGPTPNTSYSSQFDADVVRLYNQAVNDSTPDKPRKDFEMGSPGLWRNAVAAASGTFHTSSQKTKDGDLIVKWSDGEVSIFKDINEHSKLPTSGSVRQANELKIAEPGSTWKYARGIATGKYGGNTWPDDLVVRWSDGEVTMYGDASASDLGREYMLVPPPAKAYSQRSRAPNGTPDEEDRDGDTCTDVCGPGLLRRGTAA